MIDREGIVRFLTEELKDNRSIHAFWIEGADAIGTADAMSDLDLWFAAEDGREEEFIVDLQTTLKKLAPLDFIYDKSHPHPQIWQIFLHLEGTSPYLIIDVCVQSRSRDIEFVLGHADERPKVVFDKSGVIRFREIDVRRFQASVRRRVEELERTFGFFSVWVEKEAARGHFLEALHYYHVYVLKPLVELTRICCQPTKKDYYLKHIYRDVPADAVKMLEGLYKVNSVQEISARTEEARVYFRQLLASVKSRQIV